MCPECIAAWPSSDQCLGWLSLCALGADTAPTPRTCTLAAYQPDHRRRVKLAVGVCRRVSWFAFATASCNLYLNVMFTNLALASRRVCRLGIILGRALGTGVGQVRGWQGWERHSRVFTNLYILSTV